MISKLDEYKAELCKRDFYEFFCEFWGEIEASKLVLNWHIKFLCDFLQTVVERWERKEIQLDVLINIAFGLSKSTILQLLQEWIILRNPSAKIFGTSYAGKISVKNAGKVREGLKSAKFQSWYPNKILFNKEIDGKTQFANLAKGIYYTSATGAAATGMHSDFIINDDPISAKEANSQVKRETTKEYISETLSSRKTEDYTVTITIMQRLHMDDVAGYLLAKKPLQHINLPAYVDSTNRHLVKPQSALEYYDKHDGYLNPIRFGKDKIQAFKVDLGPYAFAAQVQQNPLDDSSGLFKKDNFEIISFEDFQTVTEGQKIVWNYDADTALTQNTANDPTALLASCTVEGITYIRESFAIWLEHEELLDSIYTFTKRNGLSSGSELYIEPKSGGLAVLSSLQKRQLLFVLESPAPTKDKVQRAHEVIPYVYENKVKLIDGQWVIPFLQELTTFPNGAHDDRVDTLTQCLARIIGLNTKKKKIAKIY